MSSKKSKASTGRLFDALNDLVSRTVDMAGDIIETGSSSSKDFSFSTAKRLLEIQQGTIKTGLGLVSKANKQVDKILRDSVKKQEWMPEEGKECVDEWADMLDAGLTEFSRVVDSSFEKILQVVERSSKKEDKADTKAEAKAAPAKKAATKKAAASKATTKKPAVKKPATKKAPAKKPATKKAAPKKKS